MTRAIRVIDEKPAIAGIIRVKCEPQQPSLAAGRKQPADVEKGIAHHFAALEDADGPRLLEHEQPRVIGRRRDEKRLTEDVGDHLKLEQRFLGENRAGEHSAQGHKGGERGPGHLLILC